jgi:hypothetical protein
MAGSLIPGRQLTSAAPLNPGRQPTGPELFFAPPPAARALTRNPLAKGKTFHPIAIPYFVARLCATVLPFHLLVS